MSPGAGKVCTGHIASLSRAMLLHKPIGSCPLESCLRSLDGQITHVIQKDQHHGLRGHTFWVGAFGEKIFNFNFLIIKLGKISCLSPVVKQMIHEFSLVSYVIFAVLNYLLRITWRCVYILFLFIFEWGI